MTYKTILVHLTDEQRVAALLDAAFQVADPSEAHVTALYVMPPLPTYGPAAYGAGMIQSSRAAFDEMAGRVRAAFEEACRGRSVVPEWVSLEPGNAGVAAAVIDRARTADLVVAGQRDPDFAFSRVLDVPEDLVLECGRPVLVVPRVGRYPTIGRRVTVAWNTRREATRAVFDAMPLLQRADAVRIVWVNPQAERALAGDLPGAEIATTLARQGVKCEIATAVSDEIGVGDVLLSGLMDDGADLLVMGAWGHSRLREMMFGGATRHILEHMTVPVLMSH